MRKKGGVGFSGLETKDRPGCFINIQLEENSRPNRSLNCHGKPCQGQGEEFQKNRAIWVAVQGTDMTEVPWQSVAGTLKETSITSPKKLDPSGSAPAVSWTTAPADPAAQTSPPALHASAALLPSAASQSAPGTPQTRTPQTLARLSPPHH